MPTIPITPGRLTGDVLEACHRRYLEGADLAAWAEALLTAGYESEAIVEAVGNPDMPWQRAPIVFSQMCSDIGLSEDVANEVAGLKEEVRAVREEARAEVRIDPNVAPPSRNWFFGVYPERAPRGLRLRQIVRGSAADRFGLEIGDYVLDVGGYVVGEYQGQHYPLSMAMDYGADANGWAEILVWNRRTFREETMWVRFTRR